VKLYKTLPDVSTVGFPFKDPPSLLAPKTSCITNVSLCY
jgi:hypothetical protein